MKFNQEVVRTARIKKTGNTALHLGKIGALEKAFDRFDTHMNDKEKPNVSLFQRPRVVTSKW